MNQPWRRFPSRSDSDQITSNLPDFFRGSNDQVFVTDGESVFFVNEYDIKWDNDFPYINRYPATYSGRPKYSDGKKICLIAWAPMVVPVTKP